MIKDHENNLAHCESKNNGKTAMWLWEYNKDNPIDIIKYKKCKKYTYAEIWCISIIKNRSKYYLVKEPHYILNQRIIILFYDL